MKSAFLLIPAVVLILPAWARTDSVAGRVLGPDGKPVLATVFFINNGGWTAAKTSVQSAADGSFSFEIAPPKPREGQSDRAPLHPESRGAAAAWVPGLSLSMAPLQVGVSATLKLAPQRKVAGVLRDDKGAPVAGASVAVDFMFQYFGGGRDAEHVFFSPPPSLAAALSARTDAAGRWEIAGVPAQGDMSIELKDEDFVRDAVQIDAEGEESGPSRKGLVARRAGSISGRVLDAQGKPAADVGVSAVIAEGPKSSWSGVAKSGTDGVFHIKSLPPGTYSLLVGVGGYRSEKDPRYVAEAIQGVRVQAGQASANNRLRLVAPVMVKGRVLDRATGQPLAEAQVGAFGAGTPREVGPQVLARTDSQGRYEVALVPGANALYAYEENSWDSRDKPVLKPVPVTMEAGHSKTMSLWLDRRFADVQGTVVLEDGTPASGVGITLWNSRGTGQTLRSDGAGSYEVKRLQLGAQRFAPDAAWTIISPKSLSLPVAGGKPVQIVVRRNAMAKVTGRVVDGAGRPVAGAKVNFEMPAQKDGQEVRFHLRGTSDEAGVYTLGELKMPEALGMQIKTADLKGYKKRAGGEVPAASKAGPEAQTEVRLSDIVLDRLGRDLKGRITLAGQPVAGALVRASGDSFENIAATDAEGRFTLAGQSEGELQVLAASGHGFGRVVVAQGEARIEMQAGAAPPARDVARAAQIFREMAPFANDSTLREAAHAIAPHDPATAMELLLAKPAEGKAIDSPDEARRLTLGFLTPNSSESALEWAQQELANIAGEAEFIEQATALGLTLAARRPEEAQSLLQAAGARLVRVPQDKALLSRARLAALATRLKLPASGDMVSEVLTQAQPNPDKLREVVAPLAAGSAEVAAQVLGMLPEKQERTINLYRSAIREVAIYDAAGALPLLEEMRTLVDAVPDLPDEKEQYRGHNSWEFEWAFAAKNVLRGLDRSQAEVAAGIARRVKLWHRPSALALAAEFGSPAQRLAMVQEAVAVEERGPWMKNITVARLGALAADVDASVAQDFFAQTAQSIESQRRERGESSMSDWGFYAAFWNPAQARLALEADWQRSVERAEESARRNEKDEHHMAEWSQGTIPMAMAAVDVSRALELARQLSDKTVPLNPSQKARAMTFIGLLLLEDPARRRLMVIGAESGYDS